MRLISGATNRASNRHLFPHEVTTIEIEARPSSPNRGMTLGHPVQSRRLMDDQGFETPRRIAEFDLSAPGRQRIALTLRDENGISVARRVIDGVQVDDRRTVVMRIPRSCADVSCPPDGHPEATECLRGDGPGAGICVEPACINPEITPEHCPATAECEIDSDCTPSAACSSAYCASGVCFDSLAPGACAPDEYCDPTLNACISASSDLSPARPDGGVLIPSPGDESCDEYGYHRGADGLCIPVGVQDLAFGADATSQGHAIALMLGGHVYTWGSGSFGALGHGTSESRDRPTHVEGLSSVSQVTAGYRRSCAVVGSDRLFCWGSNEGGFFEADGPLWLTSPSEVDLGDRGIVDVCLGKAHACAITSRPSDWSIDCWGDDSRGQLQSQSTDERSMTSAPTSLACGSYHTCAIWSHGSITCWGSNEEGALGTGTTEDTSEPIRLFPPAGRTYDQVVAGLHYTCASANGEVYCWGDNARAQLGNPGGPYLSPTEVSLPSLSRRLVAGASHACSHDEDGQVHCWGSNHSGQLGTPADENEYAFSPRPLDTPESTLRIFAGDRNGCYSTADSELFCWGHNESAQLGLGHSAPTVAPSAVLFP